MVLQNTAINTTSPNQPLLPTTLSALLDQFSKVFDIPSRLPQIQGHEHQIVLKEGAKPVCERPYRYPYFQKSEIEKIVNELLDVNSIQPS